MWFFLNLVYTVNSTEGRWREQSQRGELQGGVSCLIWTLWLKRRHFYVVVVVPHLDALIGMNGSIAGVELICLCRLCQEEWEPY